MDNKQYNALFSFIWNIANNLPNSRKKGYLILGAHDNGGNVVGKVGGKVGGKNGGKNGGDKCPQFVPSCHKLEGQGCKLRAQRCNLRPKGCNLERKVAT
ncbi:MAG: hypothetical protein IKQ03_03730 [Prevotella sp.]|nr:hypothetical protein [Prevotella sp.]